MICMLSTPIIPMKHGYVKRPSDWEYSTFRNFLKNGYYDKSWGIRRDLSFDGEYGE